MKLPQLDFRKELPIILIAISPLLYLAYIWNSLPEMVPTHWNWNGEIDRWNQKNSLIFLTIALNLGSYLSLTAGQFSKHNSWISALGEKFTQLKFALTTVLSALTLFIFHSSKEEKLSDKLLFIIIAMIFIVVGNFMANVKPNNLFGIRIKTTLNDEDNWKHTHRLASKLWILGGVLTILFSILLDNKLNKILFLITSAILVIIPILYSNNFKKINSKE